jgi:hypothetical protein
MIRLVSFFEIGAWLIEFNIDRMAILDILFNNAFQCMGGNNS